MGFLYTQWRYNSSKNSSNQPPSIRQKAGLLVFDDIPFKETHIVFNTRNLTKSIFNINNKPSNHKDNDSTQKNINNVAPRYPLELPCLLSTHGLRRRESTFSVNQTLSLLPLTVCTKHGKTSFLPLDYVKVMGEYTCTTYNHPVFKVVHHFDDCILEFPIPPPIGSSEEQSSEIDCSNNCYQCFTPLSSRKTVYMYRDYLFCCQGCRLRACVTRYWYKKVMKSAEEEEKQIDFDGDAISTMEKDVFTILSW